MGVIIPGVIEKKSFYLFEISLELGEKGHLVWGCLEV